MSSISSSSKPETVKVIILVSESEENSNQLENIDSNFSEESFEKSWRQAKIGRTLPLSELWEDTEIV